MHDITHIPLTEIDKEALPRDRSASDPQADTQLWRSIARDGLRQPIEVFPIEGPIPYALISGYRRMTAYETLLEMNKKWDTIPAFIRTPETLPEAMTAMVAENEIRAQLSPWDRARTILDAVERQIFPTYDAAIAALHPTASSQKNSRLRTLTSVVEAFYGIFRDPHGLSERRLLRLAALERAGLQDLAFDAIRRHKPKDTETAYALIAPIIDEAEQLLAGAPRLKRPRNPTRTAELAKNLHIRRELRPDGWALIMTGPDATGMLCKMAMDEVIYKLSPVD
ncbi:MAG: ParB N-terminal domain-containing protein [Pseudomonadota bacterium]